MIIKKILYVDMDGVLVDFQSALKKLPQELVQEYKKREDEIPDIFKLMDPMPDAIESFTEIAELFDTYILSTAPWENPSAWTDKLNWVKRYLGSPAYKRLILSHHKNLNTGHFLIDDRTKHGADSFVGKHIHFGTAEFPNWQAVTIYLKVRAA